MSTPLTADYRIKIEFQQNGQPHVWHGYCRLNDLGDSPPSIKDRTLASPISWTDAAQAACDGLSFVWAALDADPIATLEHLVGILWLPQDFATLTSPASGTLVPASMFTLVCRTSSNKKIRVIAMETGDGYVGHSPSGMGINGQADQMVPYWDGSSIIANAPFLWQVARNNAFIAATGGVAGGTYDLNDRMKRRRGLE
jgi:hypothetical protein